MTNYCAVDYDQASPQLKAVYDEYTETTGNVKLPNWLTYLGEMPQVLNCVWLLIKSVMFEGQLSPLLQELIFYSVAHHRTAPYCMSLHGQNLLRMTEGSISYRWGISDNHLFYEPCRFQAAYGCWFLSSASYGDYCTGGSGCLL